MALYSLSLSYNPASIGVHIYPEVNWRGWLLDRSRSLKKLNNFHLLYLVTSSTPTFQQRSQTNPFLIGTLDGLRFQQIFRISLILTRPYLRDNFVSSWEHWWADCGHSFSTGLIGTFASLHLPWVDPRIRCRYLLVLCVMIEPEIHTEEIPRIRTSSSYVYQKFNRRAKDQ